MFGITFDDGFRNVFENVTPVLSELGFTATNYFVSHQFDGGNVWDKHGHSARAAHVRERDARLGQAGNEVGSHTLDHVHLLRAAARRGAPPDRPVQDELEQALGAPVTAFCYPYGEQQQEHRDMAREAGYDNATLTVRGRAGADDDVRPAARDIARSTGILRFPKKCLTRYEDSRRRG